MCLCVCVCVVCGVWKLRVYRFKSLEKGICVECKVSRTKISENAMFSPVLYGRLRTDLVDKINFSLKFVKVHSLNMFRVAGYSLLYHR